MSNDEKIVNVTQAVEIIASKMKEIGFRATKLKNYGYYSFSFKNLLYRGRLMSLFDEDERFEIVEVIPYTEYFIKVKDVDYGFKLNYESKKQSSKFILNLDI